MDLKHENLCASCARIYECSACRPQQGEKITLGITSVSHVRRDYGCSSGYWRIFPRFKVISEAVQSGQALKRQLIPIRLVV